VCVFVFMCVVGSPPVDLNERERGPDTQIGKMPGVFVFEKFQKKP
jgi:hypothetical protein